ncbi:response regulator transcription factor [Saccharopolyspora spinosa]|uniref:DNA-binding NarL/FixJ family response regulator n=1 Tax=Saccharopolyspora spinosa TaxID=60894 RepID=A0A2N3XWJ3_SACSN|nr:response regulator transcription factor [Saccharopolyspora spinosa]PKW15046.1 DNA-binding NarL/FixJ family response regulator [Saccharopolyspora spinosa]
METATMTKIRVAIVSADAMTRAGLQHYLHSDRCLVETSIDRRDADIVVMAVDTINSSTMDLIGELSPGNSTRFLLIVDKHGHADFHLAVERGVRGVLRRHQCSRDAFVQALLAIADGAGFLPPSLQGVLMDQVRRMTREVLVPRGLTVPELADREVDVLRLLSYGFNVQEISNKLSYSERTIKNIIHSVMKNHNFRNRTHAVSFALRSGLI